MQALELWATLKIIGIILPLAIIVICGLCILLSIVHSIFKERTKRREK